MGYTEGLAEVIDWQIEYLDTGPPSTPNYQTLLLLPGAAHTARPNPRWNI
jgi:hypothetical protein